MATGQFVLFTAMLLLLHAMANGHPNVLFVVTEDIIPEPTASQSGDENGAPWLDPEVHTPNLQALASKSLLASRCFTQYPLGNPSRTCLLTGRRPDSTKVFDDESYWRKTGGDFTTLPQYFKDMGYHTASIGKIYGGGWDDLPSWSEPSFLPDDSTEVTDSCESTSSDDHEETAPLEDQFSLKATETIQRLSKQDKPFFLALSFTKDYIYSRTTEKRYSYYAAVSYMDSMLGKVLQKLDKLELAGNTIIVFHAENEWHLGEHCKWTRRSTVEATTHVSLMIHVPKITDNGIVADDFIELVDVFPTLVEATGLPQLEACPKDSGDVVLCREGDSLFPLMKGQNITWKDTALSQIFCPNMPPDNLDYMGYSIRSDKYRLVEYPVWADQKADWNNIFGAALFDLDNDPTHIYNFVGELGYADVVEELKEKLRHGWKPVPT